MDYLLLQMDGLVMRLNAFIFVEMEKWQKERLVTMASMMKTVVQLIAKEFEMDSTVKEEISKQQQIAKQSVEMV